MSCSRCQLPIREATILDRQCPFCSTTFSRIAGARRHAKVCAQRDDRPLQSAKRGRKAVSCDWCLRAKKYCNVREQNPCGGCASRNLTCTFSRHCRCGNLPNHDVASSGPPSPQEVAPAEELGQARHSERASLSFILNSTDDRKDFVTERAVGEEPDGALLGPTGLKPPQAQTWESETVDCIDPTLLLSSYCEPDVTTSALNGLYNTGDESLLGTFLSARNHEDKLAVRIGLLEMRLGDHVRSNNGQREEFDKIVFRRLFRVYNVQAFAATFCRKRHYRYPILHWPTFVLEDASLPLLMVVALTGATYSLHPEHESSQVNDARSLYSLAGSFVSHYISAYLAGSHFDITEAVQLCQAALLMYGLDTLVVRDVAMQRTAITTRLPALISALRTLKFASCRHDASEDWKLFIQREQIIRLVSWTFCADCLATLSYNKPPSFTILEMIGDLPCSPELWDADSALEFELLRASQQQSARCLRDAMGIFLGDEDQQSLESLPLAHLHVFMCAFQQTIFNLHVTMMLPQQAAKVQGMFATWRQLWERAIQNISDGHRSWLGVARYIPGIEYLSRRVIEVAISPESADSRYLQRIPSYSTRDIYDFIRDFVTKP